jgi:hypothetical protein
MKRFLVLFFALTSSLFAQQPQSTTDPDFGVSATYMQGGSAGGYRPTAGSGLTLTLGPGTAWCKGVIVTYPGGTLTLTASSSNYVYLDAAGACAPAVSTFAFLPQNRPIAVITTSGSAITTIVDDRTIFSLQLNCSGIGSPTFISAGNCQTGGTSCTIALTNTAHDHLFVAEESSATATISVSDSNSQTYIPVNPNTVDAYVPAPGEGATETFEADNILAGSNTITCTTTNSRAVMNCVAFEFSDGLTTSALDQATQQQNGPSATPSSGATATTVTPNELVIGFVGGQENNGQTVIPGPGFTICAGCYNQSGSIFGAMEYKNVSCAAPYTAIFGTNTGTGMLENSVANVATFK